MCNKYCFFGIQFEYYEIVGKYLIMVFIEVFGLVMILQVYLVWEKVYWLLVKMFIGWEVQFYRDFELWSLWCKFKIDWVVLEMEDIYFFYFVLQDGKKLFKFFLGQYIFLWVNGLEGYFQLRQYLFSEVWKFDYYCIMVKRDEGVRYFNLVL